MKDEGQEEGRGKDGGVGAVNILRENGTENIEQWQETAQDRSVWSMVAEAKDLRGLWWLRSR
jgi:hypothetical protein